MSHTMTMVLIMSVPLITWLGIFGYLLVIDRSLRRLEQSKKEQEEDL